MKNVIITGANGMIGGLVLDLCLKRNDVQRVTAITRRPMDLHHEKLVNVVHQDYLDYSAIEEHLKDQQVCFYCIGVYTGQVPTEEFKKITVDFTRAFAGALKKSSPGATFCFLSGQGADSSEKSRILFAKQKGIAENLILELQFPHTHIFRPGYIYPVTPREEPNSAYRVMRRLYKPLSFLYPNLGVTSVKLAEKMVTAGLDGSDRVIYENGDIRK